MKLCCLHPARAMLRTGAGLNRVLLYRSSCGVLFHDGEHMGVMRADKKGMDGEQDWLAMLCQLCSRAYVLVHTAMCRSLKHASSWLSWRLSCPQRLSRRGQRRLTFLLARSRCCAESSAVSRGCVPRAVQSVGAVCREQGKEQVLCREQGS